jgi:putative ABC transport system substrate-binding protein
MLKLAQRLWLGTLLIVLACSILLFSDLSHRRKTRTEAPTVASRVLDKPVEGRVYKVAVVYVTPHKLFDQTIVGIRRGFADKGFVEGKNLSMTISHANGDHSILQQLVTSTAGGDADLVFALSTPGLGAVAARVKNKPVIFAEVTEPVGAGAGKSFTDHQANVTGSVAPAPLEGGFTWLMRLFPNIRRVGMIYTPSEPNVMTEVRIAKQFAEKYGFTMVLRAASTPSEVPEALNSILAEGIDAFFYEGDNAIMSAEPAIIDGCRRRNIPILGDDESEMGRGTLLACGVSPIGNGYFGAELASRVLLGEDPAKIPFTPSTLEEYSIDLAAAQKLGIVFPDELLAVTDIVHNLPVCFGRPARIALFAPQDEAAAEVKSAFLAALSNGGLEEGRDYELCPSDAVREADLAVSFSDESAKALAASAPQVPILFALCGSPAATGMDNLVAAGRATGIYEEGAIPTGEPAKERAEAAAKMAVKLLAGLPVRKLPPVATGK